VWPTYKNNGDSKKTRTSNKHTRVNTAKQLALIYEDLHRGSRRQ